MQSSIPIICLLQAHCTHQISSRRADNHLGPSCRVWTRPIKKCHIKILLIYLAKTFIIPTHLFLLQTWAKLRGERVESEKEKTKKPRERKKEERKWNIDRTKYDIMKYEGRSWKNLTRRRGWTWPSNQIKTHNFINEISWINTSLKNPKGTRTHISKMIQRKDYNLLNMFAFFPSFPDYNLYYSITKDWLDGMLSYLSHSNLILVLGMTIS